MFLKLIGMDSDLATWVRAEAIQSVTLSSRGGTYIEMTNGDSMEARESPSEVLDFLVPPGVNPREATLDDLIPDLRLMQEGLARLEEAVVNLQQVVQALGQTPPSIAFYQDDPRA